MVSFCLPAGRDIQSLCRMSPPNAVAHSALITSPTLFASMSLSCTVNGVAASSNLTLLRTPSQPLAPVELSDCTRCPPCTTSIQPSDDNVILYVAAFVGAGD